MASGRRHEALNLLALGAMTAGWLALRAAGHGPELERLLPPPARVAFLSGFLVGTFLVTPDLDLANRSVRAKSNWGVLGWLWLPYGVVFRHRGLSHSWFLGPLTRLLYLLVLALALSELASVIAAALGYSLSFRAGLAGNWLPLLWGSALGYYVSQWLHLLADGLPRPARSTRRR